MPREKRNRKTVNLKVRVSEALYRRLKEAASARGRSRSEIIRRALRQYLRETQKNVPQ